MTGSGSTGLISGQATPGTHKQLRTAHCGCQAEGCSDIFRGVVQIYFLTVLYLLYGAGMIIRFEAGGRVRGVWELRRLFDNHRWCRVILIAGGIILDLLLLFFPYYPGPMFIGDVVPAANILGLIVLYISKASSHGARKMIRDRSESVISYSGRLLEAGQSFFGFLTLATAIIHFAVPSLVLF